MKQDAIGRPVRIASIGFRPRNVADILPVLEAEAARGVDLIVLPETMTGQADHSPETLDGPTVRAVAEVARAHGCWIICPIDRIAADRRLNTAVLIDRSGAVAGHYDKNYPFLDELELEPPVWPGADAPVFETDFGRLGIAICFDVNFPELWAELADKGAELIAWPSAYSAGTSLQAHALNHHYAIVTATQMADCLVYDIDGSQMLSEQDADIHVSRVTIDLDRVLCHENFNMERRDRLLAAHPAAVAEERHLVKEQWFVLKATQPGVSARALAEEFGLVELRDYLVSARRRIRSLSS